MKDSEFSGDRSAAPAFERVGVIGGGAWGTALAALAAGNGAEVLIWAREAEVVAGINEARENKLFLPDVALRGNLRATGRAADFADFEAVLAVAPAQFSRAIFAEFAPHLRAGAALLLCSKGIERGSGALLTDIARSCFPEAVLGVLSGPSFAADVARGLPTAVTLACRADAAGGRWRATLGAPHFRPYLTRDLIGAEIGGALKNIYAIAAGIVAGKALGDSARAALIARAFAEMRRFAGALGAEPDTLNGLSGLGDLVLTCGSPQSRNMSLGMALGEGRRLDEAMADRRSVAEGVETARAVREKARRLEVEMPICEAVAAIVDGEIGVDDAIQAIIARPFRREADA